MREVTVAATQMACSWDRERTLKDAEQLVRDAAAQGAQIILLQELFAAPYFCKDQDPGHFALAEELEGNALLKRFSALARELEVVLPISFFERAGRAFFNSLAMVDADGAVLDVYRKSHIPNSVGYQEKFFFSPGDTGFKVWRTAHATLGAAICWDQWFPEAARCLALQGAELLLYPTAIGSEPAFPEIDSKDHWQRVMQGHAAANLVPVVASNRIGAEAGSSCAVNFYGSSFISDHAGAIVAEASRTEREVVVATFDLDAVERERVSWGVFRDRRPDLYAALLNLDGRPAGAGGGRPAGDSRGVER
ncbi:MAG: N-carbamoylputrescine amidase [Gammaproteobacteria bacterium]|nr:N-carbamoylputrescine amidase [Gammaproteobacteria bacterium]